MGTSHAHGSRNGYGHACDNDHDHDCGCKPERTLIHEPHHHYAAKVHGDYDVEPDDAKVYVYNDGNGNAPAEVNLPCPSDVPGEHGHVTVVNAGQSSVVVRNAGEDGDRSVTIRPGNAVTFHLVPEHECECAFWAVECCTLLATP